MEDIFSTSFDSDYHFLGFSKFELDMDAARSGKVNEDMRVDRKSRSRTRSRSRSRDPHSKHGRDGEYKERRHKRDKPSQERIPRAGEALQHHRHPLQTADKLMGVGLCLRHLLSCIMPSLESVHKVVRVLRKAKAEVIKEDVTTIRS